MLVWSLWTACDGDGDGPGPTSPPLPGVPPKILSADLTTPTYAPLARRMELEADQDVSVHLELTGDGVHEVVDFAPSARRHTFTVLGAKPDRDHEVTVTVTDAEGLTASTSTTFRTAEFQSYRFPEVTVRRDAPGRSLDHVLLPLNTPDGLNWLVVVDPEDGEVEWIWTGASDFGDIEVTPQGTLLGLTAGAFVELDWSGEVVRRASATPAQGSVLIEGGMATFNHELSQVDDGWMSLASVAASSPAFPTSYETPDALGGPTDITSQVVAHVGFDGALLHSVALHDVLDTSRIGFDSLDPVAFGFDWSHANAIVSDPRGGVVVSVRHQDALVALDDDGDVRWILGSPLGWGPAWSDLVLDGLAVEDRPLHPHGPAFDADGHLIVFDNGNEGHNPYEADTGRALRSRVVAYDIDEGAGRAEVAWQWTPDDDLYSPALGNVAVLPGGHVVAGFGFVSAEGGVDNPTAGRPLRSIRVFEIEAGGDEVLLDLALDAHPDDPSGIKVYRAIPVTTMYPPSATVSSP